MSLATRALLVAAVVAAVVVLGLAWRRRNGRFTPVPGTVLAAAGHADAHPSRRLTAPELGTPLGERATFVQLSSEVCTPCRRTHAVLASLGVHGVSHVDLDVAARLDLVRRFDVMRTPTVLLLDGSGAVVGRMSGAVSRHQALAALEVGGVSVRPSP